MGLLHGLIRPQYDKLIFCELRNKPVALTVRHVHALGRDAFFLKILENLLRHVHLDPALVLVFVVKHLLCRKVLGRYPQDLRLDAK